MLSVRKGREIRDKIQHISPLTFLALFACKTSAHKSYQKFPKAKRVLVRLQHLNVLSCIQMSMNEILNFSKQKRRAVLKETNITTKNIKVDSPLK